MSTVIVFLLGESCCYRFAGESGYRANFNLLIYMKFLLFAVFQSLF